MCNFSESAVFVSLTCSLFPEDFHSDSFCFTVAGVAPCVNDLPVCHESADGIYSCRFVSLGSFGVSLKIEFR